MPSTTNLTDRVQAWIAADPDPDTRDELAELVADPSAAAAAELADRFDGKLEFGTAGLRGRLGGGPNRMNRVVVRRAAAGLVRFLQRDLGLASPLVVIGYDARNATNILGNIPVLSLKQAYDLIAPEELASIYEASFAQQMVNSLNLQHRMDDIRWGSTGFCADGFVIQDNHGYTKNDGKSVQDKNPVEQVAPPNYRWGTFITGHGELTKVGNESLNDPGADGYQLNNAGFTMGVDYRVNDHWAIGLSGAYSHTTGDLVNNGRLNTDGARLALLHLLHGRFLRGRFGYRWLEPV